MKFPLVLDLAAEGFPVRLTCGVLGFSAQAFYQWRVRPVSDRDWADAHTTNAIIDVHADDPEFGYRFIADELEAAGQRSCERRVWRLCQAQRVWSTTTKKGRKSNGKTPGPAVHDDLVQRNFTAAALDQVWLTDITEHPTLEGKLYVCAIKDCCSNRIVGYAIDSRMTAARRHRASIRDRSPPTRRHRDRSLGPRRPISRQDLPGRAEVREAHRIDGRVACAADNAAMESFHALLQKNVLDQHRWRTRDELRYAVIHWIEHTYNRRRRQRALGKLTPVEFELALTDRDDLAA